MWLQMSHQDASPIPPQPFILRRLIYTTFLLVFLLISSFCLDLLQDNDLTSLILGFLVCIIMQFICFSHCFKREMIQTGMDEIDIIQGKIKLLFGQINEQEILRKNKTKYYHSSGGADDRLFDFENEEVYQNVMTHLRAQDQIDHSENIRKIKQKWSIFEHKLSTINLFLSAHCKSFESRTPIFARFQQSISKVSEDDYSEWQSLLVLPDNHQDGTIKKSFETFLSDISVAEKYGTNQKHSRRLSWAVMTEFTEERMRLNITKFKDIKSSFQEFKMFVATIQEQNLENVKVREKLRSKYIAAVQDRQLILKNIAKTSENIDKLTKEIMKNKLKRGEGVQLILKTEFSLRLEKIELENLEVKISHANSIKLKTSEDLLRQSEQENKWLENSALQVFNNKLAMYMNQILENEEKSHEKFLNFLEGHYTFRSAGQKTMKEVGLLDRADASQLLAIFNNRKKIETNLKNYIVQAHSFCREMEDNYLETSKAIQGFMEQMFSSHETLSKNQKQKSGKEVPQHSTYATNLFDRRFLQCLLELNAHECSVVNKCRRIINDQLQNYRNSQQIFSKEYSKRVSTIYEEYCSLEVKRGSKKEELPPDQLAVRAKLQEIIQEYCDKQIQCLLPHLIETLVEEEMKSSKYINEQQQQIIYQSEAFRHGQKDRDSIRKQKSDAYMNYLSKNDIDCFYDDKLNQKKKINYGTQEHLESDSNYCQKKLWQSREEQKIYESYNENKGRSLGMINALLNVLYSEWSESQFFHEIIKEQIDISLNRKRPDIVEHIKVVYLKVDKKYTQNPIERLEVHESEIFRCLFDLWINFKGSIVVQIESKLKILGNPSLLIKLHIKEFRCPLRICFCPFSLGKSFASLLARPILDLEIDVMVGKWNITKIPFLIQIIKTVIVIKLRRKMLWPKRMTLPIPLAFKSTYDLAISQRNKYEKQMSKTKKHM